MKTITERHVQAIWYDAALRPPRLVTRRGSEVFVVSPGEWNLEAGPDFRRAVLEIGSEHRRIVGDVEIHLMPGDWELHGHGADPNYRNVIAHVTWGCGPIPSSLPPGAVSIWLGRFVTENPRFSPDQIDLAAYPFARLPLSGRPCESAIGRDPARAKAVLAVAGRHRLRMKARRLAGRLCERMRRVDVAARDGSRDDATDVLRQVFYEEVMTALGYSKNTVQFRHVAERVPIADWPDTAEGARTALGVAAEFESWDLGSCRPWNSPLNRLSAAASVFCETEAMSLAGAADFSSHGCRRMIDVLCGRAGDRRLMGRGRAAAVLTNVVAPFAMAEERLLDAPEWLPPEDVSEPVRLMAFRLFGRDHNPAAYYSTNGLLIQGLIQIHRDHCLAHYPDCTECSLAH